MKSIKEAEIHTGTRVFVAADLDVSVENGEIADTFRLDSMLPTLKYIISMGGTPVLGGHIGRPKGKVVPELSTQHLLPYFDKYLGKGKYELLENLRYDAREEAGDDSYAVELASKADLYVNEVFSTSHRKDASIVGIPKYIPSYAGLRLEQEVSTLKKLLTAPKRPFVVIIGGAKIKDKKPMATKFLDVADQILTGGKIGLQWLGNIPTKVVIPTDYAENQKDIGKETIHIYTDIIRNAKTILWAGPMGMYEEPEFMTGSVKIAESIVEATQNGAYSVTGGGDTVTILTALGLRDKVSFVSTGGGAMLDFLVNGTLPGIEALG
jgi:phosphoglycerate kinase